jgi:RNA polymerase primary sigma factor
VYSQNPGSSSYSGALAIATLAPDVRVTAGRLSMLASAPLVPSKASSPPGNWGEVVILQPETLLPAEDELAWLDAADRFLVDKFLREPLEYIDHPTLHERGAERDLFGGTARLAGDSTYFHETSQSCPGGIPREGRLDSAGERLAFRRFNYARMRVAKLLERHRRRQVSPKALREMLAWMHRTLMIRGALAQANIGLVLAMARRSHFGNLDPNEVVSAGNYALLRSIDRFDWSRGYKFSTYACQGILQRILHVVEATKRYRSRFISDFDESLEKDDAPDRRHQAQEESCVDDLKDVLARNRACLTELEQVVITRRFGLDGASGSEEPMTLQKLGGIMGVTKERIRQIQKRALHKLRCAMEREYLAA